MGISNGRSPRVSAKPVSSRTRARVQAREQVVPVRRANRAQSRLLAVDGKRRPDGRVHAVGDGRAERLSHEVPELVEHDHARRQPTNQPVRARHRQKEPVTREDERVVSSRDKLRPKGWRILDQPPSESEQDRRLIPRVRNRQRVPVRPRRDRVKVAAQ
jgi:hypothetical protein